MGSEYAASILAGAEALRVSEVMAGRRGWPVAKAEAGHHAARLEALAERSSLTFDSLRDANSTRNAAVFPQCADWTPSDWALALGGEVGEVLNKVKKLKRDGVTPEALKAVGSELADVVHYADLLAACLDIDLGRAVRDKFAEVSERRGYTGAGL